jgi:dGTPase
MLDWKKLLNPVRRRDLISGGFSLGLGVGREEQERDFDRILFAAPTRRLADKTQVFPMEENDSVRTRLTHSHEVSNLARSIGVRLAFDHAEAVFGKDHESLCVKRRVPALLAAVGLAHDLGNPPFGHQGEASMQRWFTAKHDPKSDINIEDDFLKFDGNAQTFRLLTRLQVLNDDFGLNLTFGTLAALIKYPVIYGSTQFGYKKSGIFHSESDIAAQVWDNTGLSAGVRHPLTAVMEACDDIAYSVIDAEDTVKKACASFYDLMNYIDGQTDDSVSKDIVLKSREKNAALKSKNLSSRELNDVSMQIFRAIAISKMVESATNTFVKNVPRLMDASPGLCFELIKSSDCAAFCKAVKDFDKRYGFQHRDVLRLELQGHNYIHAVMDMIWNAIPGSGIDEREPFSRFVYGSISENYRRIFESSSRSNRDKRQLVCDAVSGMTEGFLVKFFNELSRLKNVG